MNKKDLGWTASLPGCDRVLLFAGAEFIMMMTEKNVSEEFNITRRFICIRFQNVRFEIRKL